jgi:hypothetical protein
MSEASIIIERFVDSTRQHQVSCGKSAEFVVAGSHSYEELLGAALAIFKDDLRYPVDKYSKDKSKFQLFGFDVFKTYAVKTGFFPANKDSE